MSIPRNACAVVMFFGCGVRPVDGIDPEARDPAALRSEEVLTEVWTAESNMAGAQFGNPVASAGDVNGDGFDDVIVSASDYPVYESAEGRVYLYLGSASGLGTTEVWTASGPDYQNAKFGDSAGSAGDVNDDGYDDVVIGMPEPGSGHAHLYLGSSAGLSALADWMVAVDDNGADFGESVASAGDVNADGYDDVIVGAPSHDGVISDVGSASTFLGSATGLSLIPDWTAMWDTRISLGRDVSSAGDANGDGYEDVIVGAPGYDSDDTSANGNQGVFLYLGTAMGLETTEAWIAQSDQNGTYFGHRIAAAGDVNGDGFDDVVLGEYDYYVELDDTGRATVFLGSPTGLEAESAWSAEGTQDNASFGHAVSTAGDVNDDGYDDVLVGAPTVTTAGGVDGGEAYLYLGGAVGLDATPNWIGEANQDGAWMGISVATAGDVNSDGYDDVVVGASLYSNGEAAEGKAYLYLGACVDDSVDSDADGVGDVCDRCAGFDDALDGDVDSVPDDCDVCSTTFDPMQEDEDADGVGDACDLCPAGSPDVDGDGYCAAQDCDDNDGTAYPAAPELCDGVDNACAGSIPADELDQDGDGSPNCADCADADPARFPSAPELCNDIDDDCDGAVGLDENDDDGDHQSVCDGDCDDAEPRASSALFELCGDGIDNNCDGTADESCTGQAVDGSCGGCNAGGMGSASLVLSLVLASQALLRSTRKRGSP